ncbi:hypothetical protein Bca101_067477 [Brassica carinata]
MKQLYVVYERVPLVTMLLEIIFQTQIIRRVHHFQFHLFFRLDLASHFLQFIVYIHHALSQHLLLPLVQFMGLVCVKLSLQMVSITLPAFDSRKVANLCWLCVHSISN